ALKFTPAGGTIRIWTGVEGGEALLRVSDSGVGMSPDLLPRIFDLFVQGDQPPERASGGLGIGLTLVRQLVELHGGRVGARRAGGPPAPRTRPGGHRMPGSERLWGGAPDPRDRVRPRDQADRAHRLRAERGHAAGARGGLRPAPREARRARAPRRGAARAAAD